MEFSAFITALLLSTTALAQVCTIQGHQYKEVVTLALLTSDENQFVQQTSNVKHYLIKSTVQEVSNSVDFNIYQGTLSAPPFWPGILFRLSINNNNPEKSLYEVIGQYRTIPFVAQCQP